MPLWQSTAPATRSHSIPTSCEIDDHFLLQEVLSGVPPRFRSGLARPTAPLLTIPSHPGLHLKQVHPSRPIYSARVSLGYRALAIRDEETWIWFWIGSHSDYDQLLPRL